MSKDLSDGVALTTHQHDMVHENVSNRDGSIESSGACIGDYTVKTRNLKIADAIAEYRSKTPISKF